MLEVNRWNNRFGWINAGSTGIAVFEPDYGNGPQKVKYYFDISDTHETRISKPVPVREVKPEYAPEIIKTLEAQFGELENTEDLAQALISAAGNAVEDNMQDYLSALLKNLPNSLMDGLDDQEVSVMFRRLLQNSVAYIFLARCGLDPAHHFSRDDFQT